MCDKRTVIEKHTTLQWCLLGLFLAKQYNPLIWLYKIKWKFDQDYIFTKY